MAVSDWSATAADNTALGAVSIAEGMAPGDVNNAIREMMAQLVTAFVPTTNSNGTCYKIPGGLQVCFHRITGLGPVTTADGALYRSANITWTFPVAFLSTAPVIGALPSTGLGRGLAGLGSDGTTTSGTSFMLWHTDNTFTGSTYVLSCWAVGRWA